MKVQCTGIIIPGNSKLVTGMLTKFLTELCPGDYIEINLQVTKVLAIYSDTIVITSDIVTTTVNTNLYITKPNPMYRLSKKPYKVYGTTCIKVPNSYYADYCDKVILSTSMEDIKHDSNILIAGQIKTGLILGILQTTAKLGLKWMELPVGFRYINYYENLTFALATANSSVLTIPEFIGSINTIANTNYIELDNTRLYLTPGISINIFDDSYTVIEKVFNNTSNKYRIIFNKPFTKTATGRRYTVASNFNSLFPKDCIVQVNGKLYTVVNSTDTSIQLNYSISESMLVSVRKPLLATCVGSNSLVFSNITPPTDLLKAGNLITIQEIRDENDIKGEAINYTELRTIARSFNTHIATYETNNYAFTGVVCFGVPTYGFFQLDSIARSDTTITLYTEFNTISINPTINSYIKLGDSLHRITAIAHTNYSYEYNITFTPPKTVGSYKAYLPYEYTYPDYTDLINSLCLKLVAYNIQMGMHSLMSLETLYKLFLFTAYYSLSMFSKPAEVYNEYNPMYFCTSKLAAAPINFSITYALDKYTSTNKHAYFNIATRRCGHYIRSSK